MLRCLGRTGLSEKVAGNCQVYDDAGLLNTLAEVNEIMLFFPLQDRAHPPLF